MAPMEKITSRDNRRLVNARKVRDGKASGRMFVEGRRLVEEALRSGLVIDEAFVAEGFGDLEMVEAVREMAGSMAEVSASVFDSVADTKQPQGIILIAKRPENKIAALESKLTSGGLPIVIFLSEINNPANLGAIMRTAEAAGVAGVIVSANSADAFSPKATRAAMGSNFRLPIIENADFDEVLQWAAGRELITTAADISAECSYLEVDWKTPRLLVFGSEAHGLGRNEMAAMDETVGIPMENGVESLNLAVSAGIILFEAKRQNR